MHPDKGRLCRSLACANPFACELKYCPESRLGVTSLGQAWVAAKKLKTSLKPIFNRFLVLFSDMHRHKLCIIIILNKPRPRSDYTGLFLGHPDTRAVTTCKVFWHWSCGSRAPRPLKCVGRQTCCPWTSSSTLASTAAIPDWGQRHVPVFNGSRVLFSPLFRWLVESHVGFLLPSSSASDLALLLPHPLASLRVSAPPCFMGLSCPLCCTSSCVSCYPLYPWFALASSRHAGSLRPATGSTWQPCHLCTHVSQSLHASLLLASIRVSVP